MRVIMADGGVAFDGLSPRERPLGGAESAFVALAEALAAEGAEVWAYAREARDLAEAGVRWRPLSELSTAAADLYVANRDARLLRRPISARRTVFWLHNPAGFLNKPRYFMPILARRPVLVFAGPSHAATAPAWISRRRAIIPLGVEAPFLETPRSVATPGRRAIFLSNPLRGLDPLLTLWSERIRPQAPEAELHLFSGPEIYGGGDKDEAMRAVLARASEMQAAGIVRRTPLPKAALAAELADARVFLYLGDIGETFCLAAAEAQAMGVPAVVRPVGAVGERVEDGVTGFVAASEADFCAAAIRVLTEDPLFARLSANALARRNSRSWRHAAQEFLALVHHAR